MNDLISVIIPLYNRVDRIARAVKSVLNQSHDNLEIIIVDDCSTDDPEEVISSLCDDRIRVLKNDRRRNAAFSRNYGCDHSQGSIIAFLDADDEWRSNHLMRKISLLMNTGVDAVIGSYCVGVDGGIVDTKYINEFEPEEDFDHWLFHRHQDICTSSIVLYKSAFYAVRFDPLLEKHQDWDFGLRLSQDHDIAVDTESTVIVHLEHTGRMSLMANHAATKYFLEKNIKRLSVESILEVNFRAMFFAIIYENDPNIVMSYLEGIKRSEASLELRRQMVLWLAEWRIGQSAIRVVWKVDQLVRKWKY